MRDLLDTAIEAHGGLERWSKIQSISVASSITGAIWAVKSQPDALKDVAILAETKRERLIMDFPGQDKRTIFTPDRVSEETASGKLIDARDDPELSFEGQTQETPWDDLHTAYFASEALWTYLNVPFLFAWDGFETEEIEPREIDGEICRRLEVTFPDYVASHSRVQYFNFGPDGLLRRHDYKVDVLGGASGLNYASDYRDVGGINFPTRRRVVGYKGNYEPIPDPVLVAIELRDFVLAT